MKIKVVVSEAGKIIAKNTIINLGVNPFDAEAGKVPLSLFQNKGNILVAKGDSNPAAINVGSDGQVLVSDSSEEAGIKWKTMQLGTITLTNSEAFAVPSGTVVTAGTVSGTFRIATSADTTNLYVTSENILSGEDGVLYAVSGTSCIVRVTSAAVAIGDNLTVSASNGIAEATTSSTHFALAVTSKAAGAVGTVICILVNTTVSTLDVPGGGTGRPSLTANAVVAGNGTDSVKLIPTHQGVLYAAGDGTEPAFSVATARANLGLGNTAGALPIANGGTAGTDVATARANLGLGSVATKAIGSATVSCPFTSTSLTVTVSGLPAGALVWIEPTEASRAAFYAADVHYSSHSANSLVLAATTNPGTISIVVGWIG